MKDIPSSILSSLEALFLQFNFRRLLFWVFIIVAAGSLLFATEGMIGYTFFFKMERKISLLKSLNELAQNGIANNSELSPIYHELVAELASYKVEPLSIKQITSALNTLSLHIPEWLGKFVSGGLLGFLVALSGLAERKKGSDRWSSLVLGGLFFGILAGLVGIIIPTIYNNLVNYIGYPILQVVAILLISRFTKKKAT